jgi:hypothetical protein
VVKGGADIVDEESSCRRSLISPLEDALEMAAEVALAEVPEDWLDVMAAEEFDVAADETIELLEADLSSRTAMGQKLHC